MRFKGTSIITDPCYIVRDYDETYPKFETWPGLEGVSQKTKFTDYTEEQMRAYRCYEKACRVWELTASSGISINQYSINVLFCIVELFLVSDFCSILIL